MPSISATLTQIRQLLSPVAEFDPARLRRAFKVSTHDYAMPVLVVPLIAALRTEAPGVDLRCVSIHPDKVLEALDRGEIDCALGGLHGLVVERVTRTALFSDRFVGVARLDHPLVGTSAVTLEDFVATPQVLMSPGGEARGDIDEARKLLGRARRIAITVPSFLTMPLILQSTDLIGVLPERLALKISAVSPLAAQADMQWLSQHFRALAAGWPQERTALNM